MAKVYSWQVKETPREYAYIVNPAYISNSSANKIYVGPELSGKNLEMVMDWASKCSISEYTIHFEKMVEYCNNNGYDVKFEDVEAYIGIKSTCDNLRGPSGRGIKNLEFGGKNNGVNTYYLRYDDGTYDTFTVNDGSNGRDGANGAQGDVGVSTAMLMVYTCGKKYENEETGEYNVPRPSGISYNFNEKRIIIPENSEWKIDDAVEPPVFSSNAIVYSDGGEEVTTINWSSPVQISGENGAPGEDGGSTEFIYRLVDYVSEIKENENYEGFVPVLEGWTDSPQGVDEENQTEWMSMRRLIKDPDNEGQKKWGPWSKPSIWSKYGVNGQDGDGVQYIYMKNNGVPPINPTPHDYSDPNGAYQEINGEWMPPIGSQYRALNLPPENHPNRANATDIIYKYDPDDETKTIGIWTDNPNEVDIDNKYSWVCVRKYKKTEHPIEKIYVVEKKENLLSLNSGVVNVDTIYYVSSEGLYYKIKNVDKYNNVSNWSRVTYKNGSDTKIVKAIPDGIKLNDIYKDDNGKSNIIEYLALIKESFTNGYLNSNQFEFYKWDEENEKYVKFEKTTEFKLRVLVEGAKYWTPFTDPTLWAKFGEDGSTGKNGRARSIRKYYKLTESTGEIPEPPTDVKNMGQWLTAFPKTVAQGGDYTVGEQAVWCSEAELWSDTLEFVNEYKTVSTREENGNINIENLFPIPTTSNTKVVEFIPEEKIKDDDIIYIQYQGEYLQWTEGSFSYPYLVSGTNGKNGTDGPLDYIAVQFAWCLERIAPPVGETGITISDLLPVTLVDDKYDTDYIIYWEDYPSPIWDDEHEGIMRIDGQYKDENGDKWRWYQCTIEVLSENKTIKKWGNPIFSNGLDGANGNMYEYRFGVTEDTKKPSYVKTGSNGKPIRYPELRNSVNERCGWFTTADNIPNMPSGGAVWQIFGEIDADGNITDRGWSDPVRVSGERGEQGLPGPVGLKGVSGIPGVGLKNKFCLGTQLDIDDNGSDWYWNNIPLDDNGEPYVDDNGNLHDNTENRNIIKRGQGYFGSQKSCTGDTCEYSSIASGEFIPENELINWFNNTEIPSDTVLKVTLNYKETDGGKELYDASLAEKTKLNKFVTETIEVKDLNNQYITVLKNRGRIIKLVENIDKVITGVSTSNTVETTVQFFLIKDIGETTENNEFNFSESITDNKKRLIYLTSKLSIEESEEFNISTWSINGNEEYELGQIGEYKHITEIVTDNNVCPEEFTVLPVYQVTGYSYIICYGNYYAWIDGKYTKVYPDIPLSEDVTEKNDIEINLNEFTGSDKNAYINAKIQEHLPIVMGTKYINVICDVEDDDYTYTINRYYKWQDFDGDNVEHKLKGVKWGAPFKIQGVAGLKGIAGTRGQVVYPMGIYDVNEVYECDNTKAPYVYDPSDGLFYVYNNTVAPWVGSLPEGYKDIYIEPIDAENNYVDVNINPVSVSKKFDSDKKRYVRYIGKIGNTDKEQYEFYEWIGESETNGKYELKSTPKYIRNGVELSSQNGEVPSNHYANIVQAGNAAPAWVRFESFEAIHTKVGIIQNGLIGSAVFNEEFMFSQQGKDKQNENSTDFQNFLSGYDYNNSLKKWYYKKGIYKNNFYNWYNTYDGYLYFDDDRHVNPYEKLPNDVEEFNGTIKIKYDDNEYLHEFRPNVCINFESGQAWFRTGDFAIGNECDNVWNIDQTKLYSENEIEKAKEEISRETESMRSYIQDQLNTQGTILDNQIRSYIQDTDPSMVVAVRSENDPSESWNESDANYKIGYVWENDYDQYNNDNIHEYVDLGLPSGTKWAKYNVGAKSETEIGLYFAWGETNGYTEEQVDDNIRDFTEEKYISKNLELTVLSSEYDAANVNMGGDWRMPTKEDFNELTANTTSMWTTVKGVPGRLFTSTNGKTLFIPAGGYCANTLSDKSNSAVIWLSESDTLNNTKSYLCLLQNNYQSVTVGDKWRGLNVRAVVSPIEKYNYYSFELITKTNNINTANGDVACSNDLLKNKYFWKKLDTLKESDKKEFWNYWRTDETPSYLYAESRLGDIWTTSNGRTYNFVKKSGNNKYTKECVNNLLKNNYIWAESDIPQSIHDYIDGKNTIYTSIPTGKTVYSGDMWFLENNDYSGKIFHGGQSGYASGICVICMENHTTKSEVNSFDFSKWGKRDDYADNVRVKQAFDEMDEMEIYLEQCAIDGMLSPQERKVLYEELLTTRNEYPIILSDAEMLGSHTAVTQYNTAYVNLFTAYRENNIILTGTTEYTEETKNGDLNFKFKYNNITGATEIVDTSYKYISEYYTARQTLLTTISVYLDSSIGYVSADTQSTKIMIMSWDDDNKLSPDELRMLKKEYNEVLVERDALLKQAHNIGINTGNTAYCTAYTQSWSAYKKAAEYYLSNDKDGNGNYINGKDSNGNVPIVTGMSIPYNYEKYIIGYYTKKLEFLDGIDKYLKTYSDDAIENAKKDLNDSIDDLRSITETLTEITADGVITYNEKIDLLNEWKELIDDYGKTIVLIKKYYGENSSFIKDLRTSAESAAVAFYYHIQEEYDNSDSFFREYHKEEGVSYIAPKVEDKIIIIDTTSNITNYENITKYYIKRYDIINSINILISDKVGDTETFKSKLKNVFGDINESDGLTLTDAFAVKNGKYITGIFNGNPELNDGEGNTLMLGLGIEKSDDSKITLYKWTSDRIKKYDNNNKPIYYEFYTNVNDKKVEEFLNNNNNYDEKLNDSLSLRVIYYYEFIDTDNEKREVFTELSIRNIKINGSKKITIKCVNNIINGDDEFETSLTFNSGYTKQINKEHLSLTKIYDNGKIITKDIDIIGGTINATINASGIFSGYVKNEEIDTKYLTSHNAEFKNIYINNNEFGVNTLITNKYIQNNKFDDVDKSTLLKLNDLDNEYFKNDSRDNVVKHETFVLIDFEYDNDGNIEEIVIPQIYASINRLTSRYDTKAGIPYFNLYCYIDSNEVFSDEKSVNPNETQKSYTSKSYSKTFSKKTIDKTQLGSTGNKHRCKVYVDYGFDLPRLHTYVGFGKSISEAYVSIYQNTNSNILIRYYSEPNTLIIATNGIKYIQNNTTFIVSNDKIVLETTKNGLNISGDGILLRLDSTNYKVGKSGNYLTLTQTTT